MCANKKPFLLIACGRSYQKQEWARQGKTGQDAERESIIWAKPQQHTYEIFEPAT